MWQTGGVVVPHCMYKCVAVHLADRKKPLLGTHQFTAGLVGGGATSQS